MASLTFSVDRELRLAACDGSLGLLRTDGAGQLLGVPYFEVFPALLYQGEDGVQKVLDSGESLSISRYRFGCLHQSFEADVLIEPLPGEGDVPSGARVQLDILQGCHLSSRLQKSQPLIDIGKTASILSHGVRNPLNAIKGAVVYLKGRYGDDANLLEFTGIMEDEIDRLENFITSFLSSSFADFEQGECDINDLLKKVEQFVLLQAAASGVTIDFRYGPVVPLRLNRFQVEHAILNLINNAISALSSGGTILVTSSMAERSGESFVVVEIRDDGPGIPECSVESFSEPLVGAASSSGKGFGLFIARETLHSHGGLLEIESAADQGTSVRCLFPAPSGGADQ